MASVVTDPHIRPKPDLLGEQASLRRHGWPFPTGRECGSPSLPPADSVQDGPTLATTQEDEAKEDSLLKRMEISGG